MPLQQLGQTEAALTILVIGATAGPWALQAAQHFTRGQILLVDPDQDLLEAFAQEVAALGVGNLKTVLAEEEDEYPLPSASVDAALLHLTYHQIDPASGFLGELSRIVKPGAPIVIVEWQPGAPSAPSDRELIGPDDLTTELDSSGFRLLHPFTTGPDQYGLTFRRPVDVTP